MSELLPPSATRLERRLATTNARLSDIAVPLGTLMNADAVPLALLPWLAWHLGVDTWKDYWPESVKRARVRSAIRIARHKGTAEAVRQVCASFGAHVAMREWFEQTPRGKPGTFEIVMTVGERGDLPCTAQYVADIIAEVDRVKRGSAHYTFTQHTVRAGTVAVVAATRIGLYRRLFLSDV
ncbi:phage tail protein I [Mycetohabitans rhizoxinica]|uniref:phage tail protein I n=1 Tax=Mycetohabitans rhizoxinica TaxID=412963 RepID=UPI0030CC5285